MRDLSSTIYGANTLVLLWYDWVGFVVLAGLIVGGLWIFYDSYWKTYEPVIILVWKIMVVAAVLLSLPAIAFAIDSRVAQNLIDFVPFVAYVGLFGGIVGFIAILGYLSKWGYQPDFDETTVHYDGYYGDTGYTDVTNQMPANYPPTFTPPNHRPVPGSFVNLKPTEYEHISEQSFRTAKPVSPVEPPTGPPPPSPKTELLNTTPEDIAYLIVHTGQRKGKDFRLREITTIGRNAQACDIVLDDPASSGQHARVKREHGQYVLYDLASTNGTQVNHAPITRHPLADGDRIQIGRIELVFMQISN